MNKYEVTDKCGMVLRFIPSSGESACHLVPPFQGSVHDSVSPLRGSVCVGVPVHGVPLRSTPCYNLPSFQDLKYLSRDYFQDLKYLSRDLFQDLKYLSRDSFQDSSPSRFILLIVILLFISTLVALEPLPYSCPQNLTAGMIPALCDDPAAAISNPVAGDRGFSSSIQYISSMKELPLYGINTISGKGIYSILAGAEFLNNDDYTAQNYYLGCRLESSFFRLGAAYQTAYDKVEDYNSDSQSWFKAGLKLGTDTASITACAENIYPTHRDRAEQIPDYTLSSSYRVDKNVQSGFGVCLYPHREAVWQFGTRTHLAKGLDTILTWQNDPSSFAYCVIISVKALQLSYAVKTHPELDWSQSLGLAVLLP